VPYAAENDPLCYPGTTVLINLLDITDPQLLEEAELAFFLTRAEEPPAGALDIDHYLALHRHLFQDVYEWAGQFRTSRIGKAGNWFCYPEYIEPELHRVFAELGDIERLQSMTGEFFAAHIAHFLAELNAVHPFREGNGRTQLSFAAMLAEQAGFRFDTSQLDPTKTMQAMIDSFSGNETPLISLIRDIIT
jgi:cell filamentation protein